MMTSEVKAADASAFTSMMMLRAFRMDTVEQADWGCDWGVTGM